MRRCLLGSGEVRVVDAEPGVQPVGEGVDGVGDQPCVVAGGDGVVGVGGVGEMLGGDMEEIARCPLARVGGADGGDEPRPGRIGGDGLGQRRAEHRVDIDDPGRPQT